MTKNKKLLMILAILVLIAGVVFVLEKTKVINLYEREQPTVVDNSGPTINFGPPTEEEIQAAEDNKTRLSEEMDKANAPQPEPTESTSKKQATPQFGYIEVAEGKVRANGFVTTTIESGGECTLLLTKESVTRKVSNPSLPDAQSTICGLMELDASTLEPGEWTATIKYSSSNYEGTSDERKITL